MDDCDYAGASTAGQPKVSLVGRGMSAENTGWLGAFTVNLQNTGSVGESPEDYWHGACR